MLMRKILSTGLAVLISAQICGVGVLPNTNFATLAQSTYAENTLEVPEEFEEYIVNAVNNLEKEIDVLDFLLEYGWDTQDVQDAYQTVIYDNPQLFFVSGAVQCSSSTSNNTGKFTKAKLLNLGYSGTKKKITAMKKEFDEAVELALESVNEDMTDVEKALAIHDYIALHTAYDTSLSKRTAYDNLVDGVSVCQGYSLAYVYLMKHKLGINCDMIASESMNHAWNYIEIGGKWYHVDITLDDPLIMNAKGQQNDTLGRVLHSNFMLSDTAVKKTPTPHKGWTTNGLPKASSKTYDKFFWKDVQSGIFKVGDLWYYTILDAKSPGLDYAKSGEMTMQALLKSYNFETKKTKTIDTIESTWLIWGNNLSWYPDSYVRLAEHDGVLYYNTLDTIYSYTPKTKKTAKFSSPSTKKGYVYGLVVTGDRLYYSIKTAADAADSLKYKSL